MSSFAVHTLDYPIHTLASAPEKSKPALLLPVSPKEQVLEVIAIVAASTITNYAGTIANPPLEETFRQ